jgi:hypothetical protein
VHFLVEHLGDVDELVADVLGEVLAVEIGQRVLAHDAGVDAASPRAEVLPLAVGEAHHAHLLDRRVV